MKEANIMKFKDNYSAAITDISVMKDGCDLLEKLVLSSTALKGGYTVVDYNEHTYIMTTEQIDWWKRIADELTADLEKVDKLTDKYGEVAVNKVLAEEINYDSVSKLHSLYEKAFARIEAELGK